MDFTLLGILINSAMTIGLYFSFIKSFFWLHKFINRIMAYIATSCKIYIAL